MKRQFEMLADYNAWANDRLYDAASRLPEAAQVARWNWGSAKIARGVLPMLSR